MFKNKLYYFLVLFFALLGTNAVSSFAQAYDFETEGIPYELPFYYETSGVTYDSVNCITTTPWVNCTYYDSSDLEVVRLYPGSYSTSAGNIYAFGEYISWAKFNFNGSSWVPNGYPGFGVGTSTYTNLQAGIDSNSNLSTGSVFSHDILAVTDNYFSKFGLPNDNYTLDDLLFSANYSMGPEPDEDPFQSIDYSGEENFYLNYYSPRPETGYINEDLNAIDITVKPNATFSTYWYTKYDSNQQNYIVIDSCDSNWENCTFTVDEIEDFIIAQSNNHLMLPFNVVDTETEYYKITLKNEDNSKRATIPIKITGDSTSSYDSIAPYIPDDSETSDLGFFGNLIRDLFLPDASFFSNHLNELNELRLEKFAFFLNTKNALTSNFATITNNPLPTLELSMFDSDPVNVLNVSAIDPYIDDIKTYASAFLWLSFAVIIFKRSILIFKS